MRRAAIGAAVSVGAAMTAFVWLFGGGAVFGQEAGTWETTKTVVQARILGEDLIHLSKPPERWVATQEGYGRYLTMLERRGFDFVEFGGSGMMFRHESGARCYGLREQFTAALFVLTVPSC